MMHPAQLAALARIFPADGPNHNGSHMKKILPVFFSRGVSVPNSPNPSFLGCLSTRSCS
jgi:hypothetical protein